MSTVNSEGFWLGGGHQSAGTSFTETAHSAVRVGWGLRLNYFWSENKSHHRNHTFVGHGARGTVKIRAHPGLLSLLSKHNGSPFLLKDGGLGAGWTQ